MYDIYILSTGIHITAAFIMYDIILLNREFHLFTDPCIEH